MAKSPNIQPLFNYVLIKPVEMETKLPSGIILPETAKKKTQIGEVVAVGPGERNPEGKVLPMLIKKGQKVLYKQWGGNDVTVENQEWLLIEEKDVMAIVE